jgi:photosystem II stability/assembly factor-like uncharacterized protein
MTRKSPPKAGINNKFIQPGLTKKELKIAKPERISTHKQRAEWFQDRAAWPWREPPIRKLVRERWRAARIPILPGYAECECVGPTNIGGRITSMTVHPDDPDSIIVGAAGGGLWKSANAGRTWKPLWHKRDLNIGSLARDPSDPDVIYCGTGEANLSADSYPGVGLYRSTNNGRTWRRWATSTKTGIPTRIGTIAVDPFDRRHILLGGVSSSDFLPAGLFYSEDMGRTWTRHAFISTQNYWCHSIIFHPIRRGTVFATVTENGWRNGIWRSLDGGQNWSQLTSGLPDSSLVQFERTSLAIAPSRPDTIYALAARGFHGVLGVFRSDDAGDSWTDISGSHFLNERQMSYNNTIVVHPNDPEHVICGGVDLHLTTNGGVTWRKITQWNADRGASNYAHADHHALAMLAAAPGRVYDCNDGGLDVSEDGGRHWVNRSNGLAVTMFYDLDVAPTNSAYFGGGAQDNGTLVTVNDTPDEFFMLLGGDGGWIVFHPANENYVFASYQYFHIYRFEGNTYKNVSPPASQQEQYSVWMAYTAITPQDPKVLFTGSRRIWRTRNSGDSWEPVSENFDNSPITAIEVSAADQERIYVGTRNGGFFRSLEGGDTWSANLASAELPGKVISRIDSSPVNADLVFVSVGGFGNSHVFRSNNGGLLWDDADGGQLPDVPHNAILIQDDEPNRIYVANDVGVFASIDSGKEWRRLTRNLPYVPVVDLVYHKRDGTLTAATYGRSIWRIQIR